MSTGTSSLCARFHRRFSTLWAITPSLSSSAKRRMSSSSFSRCFLLALVQLACTPTKSRAQMLEGWVQQQVVVTQLPQCHSARAKCRINQYNSHSPWSSQKDDQAAQVRNPMPAWPGGRGHSSQWPHAYQPADAQRQQPDCWVNKILLTYTTRRLSSVGDMLQL